MPDRVNQPAAETFDPTCSRCHGTGDYDFAKRGTAQWHQQPPCYCRFNPAGASHSWLMETRRQLRALAEKWGLA